MDAYEMVCSANARLTADVELLAAELKSSQEALAEMAELNYNLAHEPAKENSVYARLLRERDAAVTDRDRLAADVARFSRLADERHDALEDERRKCDLLSRDLNRAFDDLAAAWQAAERLRDVLKGAPELLRRLGELLGGLRCDGCANCANICAWDCDELPDDLMPCHVRAEDAIAMAAAIEEALHG